MKDKWGLREREIEKKGGCKVREIRENNGR